MCRAAEGFVGQTRIFLFYSEFNRTSIWETIMECRPTPLKWVCLQYTLTDGTKLACFSHWQMILKCDLCPLEQWSIKESCWKLLDRLHLQVARARTVCEKADHQGRSQNSPVGGDDEILANGQIEMLRSNVCSIASEKCGVGISGVCT